MIRVLLAEDHGTVREGLRLLVDAQPDMTVVGEAADGKAVLELVPAICPDVVLLDLTMPGMSGVAAARSLRTMTPPVRVVVLTRHDDPGFVQELLDAGVGAYVLKQSASTELLRAIRAVVEGRPYLDPALPPRDEPRNPRTRESTPRVTEREIEVLRLVSSGHSNKEIAAALDISIKTVEAHKANGMRKLSLRGRADVVRYALLQGWLVDP